VSRSRSRKRQLRLEYFGATLQFRRRRRRRRHRHCDFDRQSEFNLALIWGTPNQSRMKAWVHVLHRDDGRETLAFPSHCSLLTAGLFLPQTYFTNSGLPKRHAFASLGKIKTIFHLVRLCFRSILRTYSIRLSTVIICKLMREHLYELFGSEISVKSKKFPFASHNVQLGTISVCTHFIKYKIIKYLKYDFIKYNPIYNYRV
jgi:hypothetical protein